MFCVNMLQDITYFDWSPCGERLLLGTHSPTLKVSNKWAVYSYDGKLIKADLGKEGLSAGSRGGANFEFWQIAWQKRPAADFPARKFEFKALTLQDLKVQEGSFIFVVFLIKWYGSLEGENWKLGLIKISLKNRVMQLKLCNSATEKKYVPPHLRNKEKQNQKQSIVVSFYDNFFVNTELS